MIVFLNAKLVLKDGLVQNGFLAVENGLIIDIGDMAAAPETQGDTVDCKGQYLAPGFIDLHTHGAGGYDFMDGSPRDIIGAARTHMAHGTTGLLPTTLACNDEDLYAFFDAYFQAGHVTENMPHLLGIHLEGPYFAVEHKGAQPECSIRDPDPKHYLKIFEYAKGTIKRWSFAPELPGAIEMSQWLKDSGVLLSAAHTCATYDQMKTAFEHGVASLTHFYSGMSTIVRVNGHRKLGVIESAYLLDGFAVEIIADGIHLPPELLRLILRCKNHDEIFLCTDSMRGAGMPDGKYMLGPKKNNYAALVENGIAVLPDRGAFAGSVATADRLIRVMVYQAGLPVWEAVKMITITPARLIGLDRLTGSLETNKRADLVIFDEDITVKAVYVNGVKTV